MRAGRGEMPRLADGMMSVVHGLLMTLMEIFLSGALFSAYIHICRSHDRK